MESVSKFFIRKSSFHVNKLILCPDISKQKLTVKFRRAKARAEKISKFQITVTKPKGKLRQVKISKLP